MGDMVSIKELSGEKLAAMASRRSDLQIARDKVADLEIRIPEARAAHDRKFAHQTFGPEPQQSLQQIAKLEEYLLWARRSLEHREHFAEAKRIRDAREEHAALPRTRVFEVKDETGRVTRHNAHSADLLRRELQNGYTVTSEIFGFAADGTGGIAASS